ncbi:MAG TPA: polysaccharide biosynthesis tyrosine autokinase [Ignavibacteria bacterium]|nr:polysaccharide biosynthesis tyrosine autokinase [Ignavibacteria bacterium]
MQSNGYSNKFDNNLENDAFDSFDIKYYLNILRNNLIPIILIFISTLLITFYYLSQTIDIYRSTATLKVDNNEGNILETKFSENLKYEAERFIGNEIEVLKSYYFRDNVAQLLLDSLKRYPNTKEWVYITRTDDEGNTTPANSEQLRKKLIRAVSFEQSKGLDIIEIIVEGPSFVENRLITSTYAEFYKNYSKEISRQDITGVKNFLEQEKEKKFNELNIAESNLENFQERNGIFMLEAQATNLVNTISEYDAQKNNVDLDLKANELVLNGLKREYNNIDPNLYTYVEAQLNQTYLKGLQEEIAKLEIQKDVDLTQSTDPLVRQKVTQDYDKKISALEGRLNEQTQILRNSILSETPEEVKSLTNRILDASLATDALRTKSRNLSSVIRNYENEFSGLPAKNQELAKLERNKLSNEKLYLTLEEKYQEALINERTRIGNATILDPGSDNFGPVKPNRQLIVLTGALIGLGLGLAFAFTRNVLDKSIKTPEQLEAKGLSVLAWIPTVDILKEARNTTTELIIVNNTKDAASEAFKALRTRVSFSKLESDPLKTILITSSLPSEGKSFVTVNLAGSFALTGKKVIIVDCDLRKPRIHNVFETERFPGLSDYLFSNMKFEDIVRKTKLENLNYITSGTIPPNPSEMLGSLQMKEFINKLKSEYDLVLIDSPPFISVTDSEILFNITDGTIIIAKAQKTPIDILTKTYKKLYSINPHNLLGVVLNDFSFKTSYGYYYNYYYYYSKPEEKRRKKESKTEEI